MTNPLQTIPNLPPAVGLAGPEQLWINQAGVDRRTTLEDIGEFFTIGEYLPLIGGTLTGPLISTSYIAADSNISTNATMFAAGVVVNGAAGTDRLVQYQTNGTNRWALDCNSAGEGGSNGGSDFQILAYSDTGGWLGAYLTLSRANGTATFSSTLIAEGNVYSGANFIVNVAPPNANGIGFMWDQSGSWREYVTNDYHFITGPNGSCYMDASGNFYSTAGLGASAAGGVVIGGWKINEDASNNLQFYNTGAVSVFSITNGSGELNIPYGATIGNPLVLNGAAGSYRQIDFQTAGVNRWVLAGANASAESGSNSGSDFTVFGYADNGANLGAYLTITRANGNLSVGGTGTITAGGSISTGGEFFAYGAQSIGANRAILGYYAAGTYYNAQQIGVSNAETTVVFSYNNNTLASYVSATPSDRRLKSNLKAAGDALAVIAGLPVYALDFKPRGTPGEGFSEPNSEHWPFSLIADEVAETLPHAAISADDHWVGLHPQHLIATLWRAVQQLTEQNDKLVARVQALETKVA